jgi:hypothetical protein
MSAPEDDPLVQEMAKLMTAVVESVAKLEVGYLGDGVVIVWKPTEPGGSLITKTIKPIPKGATEWKFLVRREKPDAVIYHFCGRLDEHRGLTFFLSTNGEGGVLQEVFVRDGRAEGAVPLSDEEWMQYRTKFQEATYMPALSDINPWFPKKSMN